MALITPAIPTRKPKWDSSCIANSQPFGDGVELRSMNSSSFSSSLIGKAIYVSYKPTTELLISPKAAFQYPIDRKSSLEKEILSYSLLNDGWDGDGSFKPSDNEIDRAKNFISILPSGVPLPIPMLASNGEIGFYWNTDSAYADIHLESDGLISLYTRERFGGLEENYEEIMEVDITSTWLITHLALLNERQFQIAA